MAKDGMIQLDSPVAKQLGFTSEFFTPSSYLWRSGDNIIISFIEATTKGAGHFSRLVNAIESSGLAVQVPTPLARMEVILKQWGFAPHMTDDGVELWSRPAKEAP